MDKLYKKKLEKIFNKVGRIATKGKDYIQEFTNYVNELVEKGDYSAFIETIYIYYNIDAYEKIDVNDVISTTWKEILFQTKTPFLDKLSILYKKNKIYQQSYQIYSDDPSVTSFSILNKFSTTYSVVGTSASVQLFRDGGNIFLKVLDSKIESVEIKKADWEMSRPINQKVIDEFYISYYSNSESIINFNSLTSSQTLNMSILPDKSFQKNQTVKVSNINVATNQYFLGNIISYEQNSGNLSLSIQSFSGSGTHSNWAVEYVSGTQTPIFRTNISVDYSSSYAIYTHNSKNNENYIYQISLTKDPYLGDIEEIDSFNQDDKYLVQNKQFAKIIGQRKTYLSVIKSGTTQSYAVVYENPSMSEESNLLERYKLAIKYLLS